MMDNGIGGVRVWLTVGKHAPCSSVTATQKRRPEVTMRLAASLLVLFPSSVGLQCSLSTFIMIKVQEEKSELSHGAPTLQRSVKRPL